MNVINELFESSPTKNLKKGKTLDMPSRFHNYLDELHPI